jgi:hypothetical protein
MCVIFFFCSFYVVFIIVFSFVVLFANKLYDNFVKSFPAVRQNSFTLWSKDTSTRFRFPLTVLKLTPNNIVETRQIKSNTLKPERSARREGQMVWNCLTFGNSAAVSYYWQHCILGASGRVSSVSSRSLLQYVFLSDEKMYAKCELHALAQKIQSEQAVRPSGPSLCFVFVTGTSERFDEQCEFLNYVVFSDEVPFMSHVESAAATLGSRTLKIFMSCERSGRNSDLRTCAWPCGGTSFGQRSDHKQN